MWGGGQERGGGWAMDSHVLQSHQYGRFSRESRSVIICASLHASLHAMIALTVCSAMRGPPAGKGGCRRGWCTAATCGQGGGEEASEKQPVYGTRPCESTCHMQAGPKTSMSFQSHAMMLDTAQGSLHVPATSLTHTFATCTAPPFGWHCHREQRASCPLMT